MKIKLPQSQVREFIRLGSYVDTDNILIESNKIFGYIKIDVIFGTCFMTKNNTKQFVSYSFDYNIPDCSLIVFEENIISFLKESKGENIEINDDVEMVIFSDGYYKPKFGKPLAKITDFPPTPKMSKEFIKIDKNIIDIMDLSRNYVGTDKLRQFILYSHIKEDFIFASDAQVTFCKSLPFSISDKLISLSPKECELISNFEYIEYYTNENFSIFKNGNCIYGCRLYSEIQDMSNIIKNFGKAINKNNVIKLKINDFINFCSSTTSFAKKESFKSSQIKVISEKEIQLDYSDNENSVYNTMNIESEVIGFPLGYTFLFSHSRILKVLKNIPNCEKICISDGGTNQPFCIWIESINDLDIISIKQTI